MAHCAAGDFPGLRGVNSKGECGFNLSRVKQELVHDMAGQMLKYPWKMEISYIHTEKTQQTKLLFN